MSFHRCVPSAVSSSKRIGIFLGAVGAVLLATTVAAEAKPYKGAEVDSLTSYLYGRIEVRMRMIKGSGLLSTFFTYKNGSELADAFWQEIDVEVFGKEDAKIWQSNLMTGQEPKEHSEQYHRVDKPLSEDYHTWTIEWTPDYVLWLFDGQEMRKTEGGQASVLTDKQSLRFNVWSSEVANWAGEFDEASLPAYQFVNWIKYYRYDNGKFVLSWVDDFETFDSKRWSKGDWSFNQNRVDFDPANAVVQDGTLILAITKEGATGFTGTVPVDPDGDGGGTRTLNTGGSTGSGGSSGAGGATGSGGASGASSSSSDASKKPADASGCSYSHESRVGWLSLILLGLAVVGLRARTRKR